MYVSGCKGGIVVMDNNIYLKSDTHKMFNILYIKTYAIK